MLLVTPKLMKYICPKFDGITLYPFILLKRKHLKHDPVFINHEKIHLQQQLELGVLPFYLLYVGEYATGLLKYKDSYEAYRNISFEREAYLHEKDINYLKKRKTWAFKKYLVKKA